MIPSKEIVLNNTRYQLLGLSARNGSWVAGQLLMRGLLLQLESPEKEVGEKDLGLILAAVMPSLPEEVFASIQAKCLAVCRRLDTVGEDTNFPSPVLRVDGTWNAAAEPTLPEVMALTLASLVFNLHPFFGPGALSTLLAVLPNVSQLSAPLASTATSSAQLPPATGGSAR